VNSPASPENWSFDEVRKWLVRHPDALEPGLKLMDRSLDLGQELEVPLCGVDPLGRPCLVMHTERFGARFPDRLLEIVARLRAEGARFQPLFPRPTEPRMFLLAPSYEVEVRQRLALLAAAFPLRAFLLLPPLRQETAPQLIHEQLGGEASPELLSQGLPAALQPFAGRLFGACDALRPQVLLQGRDWPLVFVGRSGPCATLYMERGELWFASSDRPGGLPLKLQDDDSVDRAIDVLMRRQEKGVSPAA
jgi:hypothetical protein